MKTILRTFAVVAGLALALPMLAQRGVSPSITNGTHLGYPAASILTPNNMRFGDSAPRGTQRFGSFAAPQFGMRSFNPQRDHREHRDHHRRSGFNSYPYYPVYYYNPYLYGYDDSYVENNSSLPGAGTFYSQPQPPASEVEYPKYRPYIESNEVIDNEGHVYVRKTEQAPETPMVEQAQPSEAPSSSGSEEEPRTLLVFKDGHQMEVSNYAIMGSTLYLFAGDHRKISLADLDLDATRKANDDRGIDFRLPNPS